MISKRQMVLSFNQDIAKYATKKLSKDLELKQRLDKDIFISTFHSYGIQILKKSGFWETHRSKVNPNKVVEYIFNHKLLEEEIKGQFYALVTNLQGHGVLTREKEKLAATLKNNWFNLLSASCDKNDAKQIHKRMDLLSSCITALDRDTSQISFDDMCRFPLLYDCFSKVNSLHIPEVLYVDEAQDLNPYQFGFIREMVKRGTRVICVGDPFQAIYAFRGASSDSMAKLKQILNATELPLSVSYRCPSAIVRYCLTDYQIAEIPAPAIEAHTTGGKVITRTSIADDIYRVDEMIANNIQMVVSPKNKHLVSVCIELLKRNQQCSIKGSRLTAIIKRTVKQLQGEHLSFPRMKQKITRLLESADVRDSQKDVLGSTLEFIDGFQITRYDALYEKLKQLDKQKKGVELNTVHSAKGLEKENVAVIDDYFRGDKDNDQTDNLKYVARTRASRLLMICRIDKRLLRKA